MEHVPPVRPPEVPAGARTTPARAPLASRGTGTRLWLCRHAQVHADFRTLAYGNRNVPLSPEGIQQTDALAHAFATEPVARVYASTLQRAELLGQLVSERTGAPLVLEPALVEIDRGDWTMLPRDEFQARWAAEAAVYHADTYAWRGHGGESDLQLYTRVAQALDRALREAPGETVLFAAHFNVVRVLLSRLLGVAPPASFLLPIQTAHATLLVDTPGGWRLEQENVSAPRGELDPA